MVADFRRYGVKSFDVPDVPNDYELDYMVWKLSDGKPSEEDYIWDNWSYKEAMQRVMFKKYDAHIQDRVINSGR